MSRVPKELSSLIAAPAEIDTSVGSELLANLKEGRGYTNSDRQRLAELLSELSERDKYGGYRKWYVPGTPFGIDKLPKHKAFFDAGAKYDERLFAAGNRVGKTTSGAAETAYHLTGEYPDWWQGKVFDSPVDAWACGKTSKVTRDTVQKELVGEVIGEGMIPRNLIHKMWSKQGTPRAIETVEVKHVSGSVSRVTFKSYEEGVQSFYGTSRQVCWCDEESDEYIYSECYLRTATTGGIIYTTFTPKHGVTPFVLSFLKDADYLADSPKIVFSDAEIEMLKDSHNG